MLRLLCGAVIFIRANCERPTTYAHEKTARASPHSEEAFKDADTNADGSRRTLPGEVKIHSQRSDAEMWGDVKEKSQRRDALMEISAPDENLALSYGNMDTLHDGTGPEGYALDPAVKKERNFSGARDTLKGEHWDQLVAKTKNATDVATQYKSKLKSLAFQLSGGQANSREMGRIVSKGHENWTRYHNISVPLNQSNYNGSEPPKGDLKFPPEPFDFNRTDFDEHKVPTAGDGTASSSSNNGQSSSSNNGQNKQVDQQPIDSGLNQNEKECVDFPGCPEAKPDDAACRGNHCDPEKCCTL